MVLSTDLMCCNVVLVRSFSLAIAKVIDRDLVMALAGAGSTLLFGPRQVSSLDEGGQRHSRIWTESRLTVSMNEARQRSTSRILEKSLERLKCLETWLSLLEPSSCEIRWLYRTYHGP